MSCKFMDFCRYCSVFGGFHDVNGNISSEDQSSGSHDFRGMLIGFFIQYSSRDSHHDDLGIVLCDIKFELSYRRSIL